jgi:hypothetical protein
MPRTILGLVLSAAALAASSACREPEPRPSGQDGWLIGTADEKFDVVSRHLRGFDMAMVETGYRYQQLYWTGEDQNWGYADYQLQKIRTAIENGLERRPARAASARVFLDTTLPAMNEAIVNRSQILFRERFVELTAACNTCHDAEKVGFARVVPPTIRTGAAR